MHVHVCTRIHIHTSNMCLYAYIHTYIGVHHFACKESQLPGPSTQGRRTCNTCTSGDMHAYIMQALAEDADDSTGSEAIRALSSLLNFDNAWQE